MHRPWQPVRAGFTLIEVLIAVLVLSLGVLGLGAVFSVGIPQQRIASDQIQGLNALESARAVLLGNERLNNPRDRIGNRGLTFQKRGWYGLQQHVADDPRRVFEPDETWSPMGEWILPLQDLGDRNIDEAWMHLDRVAEDGDKDVGEIVIVSPTLVERLNVRIGIEQRLVPAPYTNRGEPQYVWDFIARRVPSGQVDRTTNLRTPTKQDPIEIVVFVRRVDPGIRVQLSRRDDPDSRVQYGPRLRLSDYLTMNALEITGDAGGAISETQRIVPVSMDPESSQPRQDGRTLGGGNQVGEYATVFWIGVADVAAYPGARSRPGENSLAFIPRDRLPLEPASGDRNGGGDELNRLRLATQLGHKIVDRFGNVYEIRGVDQDLSSQLGVTVVRISPPAPSNVARPRDFRFKDHPDLINEAFITTPQTPIAVDVFRVHP